MAEQKQEKEPNQANAKAKKGDFVELEFIGRNLTANGEVFDTNIKEEAEKLGSKAREDSLKPLVVCIGQKMVVKGFDEALEGKELGKKLKIQLSPENGFGKRQSNLVKLIPLKVFTQQKIYPQPGMTLALDNMLVKIVSVSGGRVMADFNNPLAGKDIEFEFTIKRIISDMKEKTEALQAYFFSQVFEFSVDEKAKKLIFKDTRLLPVLNAFKEKFKEILGYDVEIFQEKKQEAKEEKKEPEKEAKLENKTEIKNNGKSG